MEAIITGLAESATFAPGDRVKTYRGSSHGVVVRVLDDGRVVWRPAGGAMEVTALPETLIREPSKDGPDR